MEEFFVTINYSYVKGGGKAVNIIAVKKKIKDKIYKEENKAFKYRAITRDNYIK